MELLAEHLEWIFYGIVGLVLIALLAFQERTFYIGVLRKFAIKLLDYLYIVVNWAACMSNPIYCPAEEETQSETEEVK